MFGDSCFPLLLLARHGQCFFWCSPHLLGTWAQVEKWRVSELAEPEPSHNGLVISCNPKQTGLAGRVFFDCLLLLFIFFTE